MPDELAVLKADFNSKRGEGYYGPPASGGVDALLLPHAHELMARVGTSSPPLAPQLDFQGDL